MAARSSSRRRAARPGGPGRAHGLPGPAGRAVTRPAPPRRQDHRFRRVRHRRSGAGGPFPRGPLLRLQALPYRDPPLTRAARRRSPNGRVVFASRFAADEGKRIRGLSAEAAGPARPLHWPGNLRQLENAVYRAVILAEGLFLTPTRIPADRVPSAGSAHRDPAASHRAIPAPKGSPQASLAPGRSPRAAARRRARRHVHARRSGGAGDSLRPCPLSRTYVGDFAASGNRAVDPLPKIERTWLRR